MASTNTNTTQMSIIVMKSAFEDSETLCFFLIGLDTENKMRPPVSLVNLGAGDMQIKNIGVTPTSFCGTEDTPSLEGHSTLSALNWNIMLLLYADSMRWSESKRDDYAEEITARHDFKFYLTIQ